MKKKELLNKIDKFIKTEESATTIFLEHLEAFSNRFGLNSEFMKQFHSILSYLITENKRHKKICEDLYAKVEKVGKDDF